MKSYPVLLVLGLVACGADNGDLFEDIGMPLPQAETPASDEGSESSTSVDASSDGSDESRASEPARDPAIDEAPPDDLTIEGPGDPAQGDGGGDEADGPGGDEDPGPVEEPVEPAPIVPQIVSVSPTDGAVGVAGDASIVVTFNVPMDQEATEQAYQSEGIPSGSVSFSWSDDGTVLTITPDEPLEYDSGTDPAEVVARNFTYFISSSARDEEGTLLGEAAEFGFSIFREITGSFLAVQDRDLTGSFRSNDTYGDGQCARDTVTLCVGDSGEAEDEQYKGFITFDLSVLPSTMARLDRAELVLEITDTSGNPFRSLGDLLIEHAAFDVIGSDAFAAEPLQSLGVLATNANQGALLSWDVREAVASDFGSRAMAQFRLYFEDDTDGDGNFDAIISSWDTLQLDVTYLLP